MNLFSKNLLLLCIFSLALALPAPQVRAASSPATATWKGTNQSWATSGSWSGGVAPGNTTAVTINNGHGPAIGSSVQVNSVIIGDTAGGSITFSTSNGRLTDATAILGNSSGGSGTASVTSGSWASTTSLTVGLSGTGELDMISGTVNVGAGAGVLSLATNANSQGTLNYTDGILLADSVSGGAGAATVNFISTMDGTFAPKLTGTLAVNFSGIGTTTTLTGSSNYSGTTTITNVSTVQVLGGQLHNDTSTLVVGTIGDDYGQLIIGATGTNGYVSANTIIVGRDAVDENSSFGANGQIFLYSGTLNATGSIVIGLGGTGLLEVHSGGTVTIDSGTGTLLLGGPLDGFFGSSGTLDYYGGTLNFATVTGSGNADSTGFASVNIYTSTFAPRIAGDEFANIGVSYLGTGTFVYSGSDSYSGNMNVENGTLKFDGGTFCLGNENGPQVQIAGQNDSTGAIIITNNAYVGATYFSVGLGDDSTGTFTMDSGTLAVVTDFTVGDSGTGTFTMTGGLVSNDEGFSTIGYFTNSSGTANMSSGTWNTSVLEVGVQGNGVFNLTGGHLTSFNPAYIGLNTTGTGTMTVSGGTFETASFVIGNSGLGTLNVQGGYVSGTDPESNSYIGSNSDGVGIINVSSGTFNVAGTLYLGLGGSGALNVTGGYASIANGVEVGYYGDDDQGHAVGTIDVSSGTLAVDGFFALGEYGQGTLNLSGGLVSAIDGEGTVFLGDAEGGSGTINFSGGNLDASVVEAGDGSGVINFTTTTSSTFTPMIESNYNPMTVNQTGTGTTLLTGSSNFTGTTTVSAGTLTVNGAMLNTSTVVNGGKLNGSGSVSDVTVNSGGVLAGTLHMGNVVINSGGTISPGNSPGANSATSLSLTAGATYQAQIAVPGGGFTGPGGHPIAGADYDQTTLTGADDGFAETVLTLESTADTGSILQWNVTGTLPEPLGTYNPAGPNTTLDNYFVLLLSDSADLISGKFARVTLDGSTFVNIDYSAGNLVGSSSVGTFTLNGTEWAISYAGDSSGNSTTGGNDVAVTEIAVIPEPSTYALWGLGLGVICWRARRRHTSL